MKYAILCLKISAWIYILGGLVFMFVMPVAGGLLALLSIIPFFVARKMERGSKAGIFCGFVLLVLYVPTFFMPLGIWGLWSLWAEKSKSGTGNTPPPKPMTQAMPTVLEAAPAQVILMPQRPASPPPEDLEQVAIRLVETGLTIGKIVRIEDGYVVQDAGRGVLVKHRLEAFDDVPEIGSMEYITHSNGRARLKKKELEKVRDNRGR